jgi:GTPase SAR1 family protein
MILVATKKDRINEDSNHVVLPKRGKELAERYNAKFFETSAYTGENVNQVFQQICTDILIQRNPKPEPPQKI